MSKLPGAFRRDAYEKIERFCSLRLQGNLSESKIADELGFGSPDAMYIQLQNYGLADSLVKPVGEVSERWRKATSKGDVKELPAAEQAEYLFRTDLNLLASYIDKIPSLREHRQGELYVSSLWVGEDWEEYHRDEYTEEQWTRVCQDFAETPAQEVFRVPISPYSHQGAGPTPWEGLTFLIAVHALMNEDLAPLIAALHDDPTSVNLEEVYKRKGKDGAKHDGVVTALKKSAEQLAVIVRGGELRRGQRSGLIGDPNNVGWSVFW